MNEQKYITISFLDKHIKVERGILREVDKESYYHIPNSTLYYKESEVLDNVPEISEDIDISIFKENKWIIDIEYWLDKTRVFVIDEESQAVLFTGGNLQTLITDKINPFVLNNNNNIL